MGLCGNLILSHVHRWRLLFFHFDNGTDNVRNDEDQVDDASWDNANSVIDSDAISLTSFPYQFQSERMHYSTGLLIQSISGSLLFYPIVNHLMLLIINRLSKGLFAAQLSS